VVVVVVVVVVVFHDDDDVECNDINDRENDSYYDDNISMLMIILNHLLKL